MGANEPSVELLHRLNGLETMKLRGFTMSCGPTGGVVIDRWNHVRGVWHFHLGNFYWTAAGNNEPVYRTVSIDDAVAYTLDVIGKT